MCKATCFKKNHTHVKKVGHDSEFPIDELWKTQKMRILKKWKEKKIAGDTMILLMCTKIHKHMRYSSWDMEWDKICHFRPFFAILPHYWPQKLNFGKNVKNTWRYYPFTHVYHKSRSYDVWFLRYKV